MCKLYKELYQNQYLPREVQYKSAAMPIYKRGDHKKIMFLGVVFMRVYRSMVLTLGPLLPSGIFR